MRKKITLKHIAKELEVSISTVSKALKDSKEIGRDTKEKVRAFAKLYNYKPNNIALSLKNRRTKNIGVIVPNIVHYFFTTVFRGIEKYSNTKGYNVITCISDESFDKEVINIDLLANGSIDGFILSLSAETQLKNDFNHLKEVTEQGIPLVLFDRVTDEIHCDKVVLNDREAAFSAVQKLISDNRSKVALVTTEDYFNVSNERASGYCEALLANGLDPNKSLKLVLPYDEDCTEKIAAFFNNTPVDAVLCVNEIFAVQCMRVIQDLGKRVPEDIAIIGFTDGILSKYASPALTTIAQHGEEMGEVAAKLLIDRIENDNDIEQEHEVFRTEVIKATLIERNSTIH